jgi:hypothetical protein
MYRNLFILVVGILLVVSASRAADTTERHGLFQQRCGDCHEGAGKLAEESLFIVDGVLFGRDSGRDIRDYLADHFGGLSGARLESVYRVLLRNAQSGGRFKERCAICHVQADALAREKLILVDGQLKGRYSGREIGTFLTGHGTRSPEEAAFFERLLRRFTASAR